MLNGCPLCSEESINGHVRVSNWNRRKILLNLFVIPHPPENNLPVNINRACNPGDGNGILWFRFIEYIERITGPGQLIKIGYEVYVSLAVMGLGFDECVRIDPDIIPLSSRWNRTGYVDPMFDIFFGHSKGIRISFL